MDHTGLARGRLPRLDAYALAKQLGRPTVDISRETIRKIDRILETAADPDAESEVRVAANVALQRIRDTDRVDGAWRAFRDAIDGVRPSELASRFDRMLARALALVELDPAEVVRAVAGLGVAAAASYDVARLAEWCAVLAQATREARLPHAAPAREAEGRRAA